jgi:hypothetical protein
VENSLIRKTFKMTHLKAYFDKKDEAVFTAGKVLKGKKILVRDVR